MPKGVKRKRKCSDKKKKKKRKKKTKVEEKVQPTQGGHDFGVVAIDLGEHDSSINIPFEFEEYLPRPPIRGLMVAPSGSGKTTLIGNLLNENQANGRNNFYKDYFGDRMTIISSTLLLDDIWKTFPDEVLKQAYFEFSPKVLSSKWQECKKDCAKNGKSAENARLFVLDDLAQEIYRGGQKSVVGDMFMSVRHCNGSVLVTTQKYKKMPGTLRTNATVIFVFEIANMAELKSIHDEHGGQLEWKQWLYMLREMVWNTPHAFLTIDLKQDPDNRFRKNFEPPLSIKEIKRRAAGGKDYTDESAEMSSDSDSDTDSLNGDDENVLMLE